MSKSQVSGLGAQMPSSKGAAAMSYRRILVTA